MSGFKAFLMRGNLISLAVAFVVGAAFTAVVTAFVNDIIDPLIAAIAGKPNFSKLVFTVHRSQFPIGLFIGSVLSFLLIASVVYWLVVSPTVALTERLAKKADATTKDCPECLSTIPIAASRCMYCTVEQPATTTAQAQPQATFAPTAPAAQAQAPRSTGRHSSGN